MAMAQSTRGKVLRYFLEIGRWVLVGYLLFPLRHRMHLPLEFTRTALGIALFVIFSGKMLYDFVIWSRRPASTRDLPRELLSILAIVVLIAVLVGAAVVFIGLYVANMIQEMQPQM
ncbi:MAG: hypothetical protein AMJ92_08705 [candidate division Zixibacteria bacterium SM23_81]|nr:MAG: hypothetical protein AMJ92_08705 [candidate division Zixibacteria bacterium SM23_81]